MGEAINDLLTALSNWVHTYRTLLVMSIAASLLTLYGDNIMLFIKKRVQKKHFLVRVSIFIAAAGVGLVFLEWLLTHKVAPIVFSFINHKYHFFVYLGFFVLIGFLADKKKQI